MDRSASAVWHGSLKEGKGTISTQSGTLKETQYGFSSRFADGVGTNPEELIAAAHAHSMYGKSWASLGRLLDPITQDACIFYGSHSLYAEFNGVVLDEERDAAGALADPFDDVLWQRMTGREFTNHLRDLHAIERRQ